MSYRKETIDLVRACERHNQTTLDLIKVCEQVMTLLTQDRVTKADRDIVCFYAQVLHELVITTSSNPPQTLPVGRQKVDVGNTELLKAMDDVDAIFGTPSPKPGHSWRN